MDSSLATEYREYAWKYFALHADHRLRAFNFFIVFSTLLIGAFATFAKASGLNIYLGLLSASLTLVAFIFWKLKERTRMLVKNGENALKYLDEQALKSEEEATRYLALFASDDTETAQLRASPPLGGFFTYSRCFRWVYASAGSLGVVGTLVCICAA